MPGINDPIQLTPQQLQQFIEAHSEKDYVLIDVRQPQEYGLAHIPGARLMPLLDLESQLFDLPVDKALVFYCRNGGRSMAASALAVEAELSEAGVYHLDGGILAWFGKTLTGFPKVRVFDRRASTGRMLYRAMDLEKGAWQFYQSVLQRYADRTFIPIFEKLSLAETAHARTIYKLWRADRSDGPSFDRLFDDLEGDIIEGGQSLAEAVDGLPPDRESSCLDLIEFALQIEYAAFDLYRVMADKNEDGHLTSAFLTLAQAEKSHMRMLSEAVAHCEQT